MEVFPDTKPNIHNNPGFRLAQQQQTQQHQQQQRAIQQMNGASTTAAATSGGTSISQQNTMQAPPHSNVNVQSPPLHQVRLLHCNQK